MFSTKLNYNSLNNTFESKRHSHISYFSSPETVSSETFSYSEDVKLPPFSPNSQYNITLPSITEALQSCTLRTKPQSPAFISLFNEAIQKRPRKKYNEVVRLYKCSHPGCNKSYGALNHLNAHISSQTHGKRRRAAEFRY